MSKSTGVVLALTFLSASSSWAQSAAFADTWLNRSRVQVQKKILSGKEAQTDRTIDLEYSIDGAGELSSPLIRKSSGSLALDQAVLRTAQRIHTEAPPSELSGRTVRFSGLAVPTESGRAD